MRIDEPHTIAPADPLSHAWKSGYAQAKEEMACDALDRIEALQAENAALLKIVAAIKRDPGGCPFCDSGKLRRPGVPDKDHWDDCAWKLMRDFDAAIDAARKP